MCIHVLQSGAERAELWLYVIYCHLGNINVSFGCMFLQQVLFWAVSLVSRPTSEANILSNKFCIELPEEGATGLNTESEKWKWLSFER